MRERSRRFDKLDDFNVWPAFADLMSNSFMIVSFLLLLAILKPLVSIASLRATEETLRKELTEASSRSESAERQVLLLEGTVSSLEQDNQRLTAQNQGLASQNQSLQVSLEEEQKTPKAPPIIVIQDTGEYEFQSGSAQLPNALGTYVRNSLVPEIEANAAQYQIDVVEVIGHTDGQPNNGGSNLDRNLENVAAGTTPVGNLAPGSNADLGLMRALAVVQALQDIQKKENRLKELEFRPYSAAQLVLPAGGLAEGDRSPDAKRRRIEIRFTRLGQVTNVE